MTPSRKWKCLFGLHHYQLIETSCKSYYRFSQKELPYRVSKTYISRCVYCGKITSKEIG